MVELMTTKTKHCWDIYLFTFNKKQEHVLGCSFPSGIFRMLTIPGEDQRERWTGNAYEHESYTDYNILICLDGRTTTEGDLNSTHLSYVAQQCKLQVWGRYVNTLK